MYYQKKNVEPIAPTADNDIDEISFVFDHEFGLDENSKRIPTSIVKN